ncbi:hypothetical protein M405DRAFT_863193 [Rhizopogon salebrosus TDB-379]|nr:hypothetical protein M405DRAFT_863193 [Rhizopogon salebrosus TDB-379]
MAILNPMDIHNKVFIPTQPFSHTYEYPSHITAIEKVNLWKLAYQKRVEGTAPTRSKSSSHPRHTTDTPSLLTFSPSIMLQVRGSVSIASLVQLEIQVCRVDGADSMLDEDADDGQK